nr:MAG TPA: Spt4/RpoE2 zinc finger [Caudoviricetes sp.]
MSCKHEFVGRSDGVKCRLCGLFLTAEQFRAELAKQENSPVITASKSKSGAKKATKKA